MRIETCQQCDTRVAVRPDGTCPGCNCNVDSPLKPDQEASRSDRQNDPYKSPTSPAADSSAGVTSPRNFKAFFCIFAFCAWQATHRVVDVSRLPRQLSQFEYGLSFEPAYLQHLYFVLNTTWYVANSTGFFIVMACLCVGWFTSGSITRSLKVGFAITVLVALFATVTVMFSHHSGVQLLPTMLSG